MASPALLIVPPTPRADATTHPQSYSDPSSSTLGTVHTQRTSSEATAETIFSLYGDDRNSWYSTKTHSLVRNNSQRESGSNYRPMSTANGHSSLSYLRQSTVGSRTSADNGTGQGRRESAPVSVHTAIVHPASPHAPPSHNPTQVESAGIQLPRSSRDSSKHDHPPSSIRFRSTSSSRPPSSSVDAPTITQSPSAAPDRSTSVPSHQSPPQRLHATLQVNVNFPPHSHSSASTSTPSSSLAPPRAPGEDPDSYHVRAIYAALDASGVKGDGYEDGEELTRARLGSNRSLVRLPLSPGPALPGDELTTAEKEILSHADRYGFFSPTSGDRMALLPSAPLTRVLSYTPASPPSSAPATPSSVATLPSQDLTQQERKREDRRVHKWGRMLVPRQLGGDISNWTVNSRKEGKFVSRVYKGVPDRWRSAAWWILIERRASMSVQPGSPGPVPRASTKDSGSLGRQYRESIDVPSSYDVQIDLDVPRTISGHVMFKTRYGMGQRAMFHVLHSFSLFCTTCGYCQGMGPLAATLLCYFEPEKVYMCLVRLHDSFAMHDIFKPGFPGLLEALYVQERILERMMPSVYDVFKKNSIASSSYATKWYITLFANSVPFQTQLRLWDAFFLEGRDLIIIIAVGIIWVYKDNLLSPQASFESILSLLSSFFVVENEDALMDWIRKTMRNRQLRRDMDRWREEWKEKVENGEDKDALL